MSMYKGKTKFTKEQLEFLVEASIYAALDRIESGLPSAGLMPKDRKKLVGVGAEPSLWDKASLETCGMNLAILYAQLTNDGLSIGDAIDFKPKGQKYSIRSMAENYIRISVSQNRQVWNRRTNEIYPNVHSLAIAWTKEMFKDYLKEA